MEQTTASVPPLLTSLSGIAGNPFLTRGDLAMLLAALPAEPAAGETEVPIMADIFAHPARESIIAVVRSGYMDAFPNHQFKPDTLISRAEVADALARTMERKGLAERSRAATDIPDIPPTNRYYEAVGMVISAGLMSLDPDGAFGPTRTVTGAEGWDIILRLNRIMAGRRG